MLPKYHIFFGIIFILVLYFLFPQLSLLSLLVIFLSNVFIDIDHGLYYLLKKKDINPLRCYNWYKDNIRKTLSLPMKERKKIYSGFYLFHGIEILAILFFLGRYINPLFTMILIGFSFHMLIDIPDEIYKKRTIHKISLVYNLYKWKELRNNS